MSITLSREEAIEQAKVLNALINLSKCTKIENTFLKAFKKGTLKKDGRRYLNGNFYLTGTKSGRLSSKSPNMQNLPSSGTKYAKPVKKAFLAPVGWLFMGIDFDSLEDKISALTTKDPNKLKVYTEGYDGHCLRAYSYFSDAMPDIDPESVDSINSIAKKYPDQRRDSKGPTFLLTYDGTHWGMMEQFGFTKEQALGIEKNYHELYIVSDNWVKEKVTTACKTGFVEAAFGLKVRTPSLLLTDLNRSYTPYQAQKESRTAGNALGQSYCMLNNRAAREFYDKVQASPYKYDIKICGLIHDAIYLLVRDVAEIVEWVNRELPECMSWQELPEIQHDEVKLSGAMELFYPSWADSIDLPVGAKMAEIKNIAQKAVAKDM